MTNGTELTIRFGLLAILLTLLLAIPKEVSGSRIRNALGAFVLVACFLIFCALLAETLLDVTLYAIPVSYVAVIALLWWVIAPKVTPRLRPLFPNRRTVQASLAWAVRVIISYGATVVFGFVLLQLPYAIFLAVTLASGLAFLAGLLGALRRFGSPANRRERLRGWGGFALVVLGMIMTFGGSFGVSLLFDFPYETGTRGVIHAYIVWPCLLSRTARLYPRIMAARIHPKARLDRHYLASHPTSDN